MKKRGLKGLLTISSFLISSGLFLISGCWEPVKTLDKEINYPQVIVNPGEVRLGVAKLRATKIVFSGSGFEPGDSIFIKLLNVPVNEKRSIYQ